MQLQSNTFQEGTEVKCEVNGAVSNDPSPSPPPELSLAVKLCGLPNHHLFHEGAPYPPPCLSGTHITNQYLSRLPSEN